ncbi:Cytochrome P450 CYP4/CYP19/CYP26 subfamily [Handroanthus impetiginosus]|uniref:Cytochrome P450 CYP4/CYP19/CYP26 subfamily n=1 Tax=Handroanthus impetiginosus TaxID=429701 RepID=A0A2G9GPX3_9LAMI|nr:Cytochrome P450 CYP4/CYP19/CYP26 subfamily [Handroanthus impetiginosus]
MFHQNLTFHKKMDISLASLLTIIATFLYLSLLILHRKTKLYKPANLPPGKMGWPIIGETSDFALSRKMGRPEKFMLDRMRRYSPEVFKTSLLGEKMAVFCGPTGNKFVFSNENKLVKSWLPRSIAKIMMPDWRESSAADKSSRIRRIYSEFLKPDAVQKYIQVMDSIARQHLGQECALNPTLKVYPLAKKLMFSTACRLFMGIEDTTHVEKLSSQFEIVASGLFSVPIDLPGTGLRRAIETANHLRNELQEIVRQEKLRMSGNKDSRSWNMLSHLLSASDGEGKLLNDYDIASTLLGILIGSQHTTSSLLTNVVYYLSDHPDVYAKALREQKEIRKLKRGEEVALDGEDTKRMKYGRSVMNEVLRLAPPGPGFFRIAIHDINFAGLTIPQGWKIFWSYNTTHRNPNYFPDPDKFDPSRFEGNGPASFTFVPFGGGPKMCPGSEFARQATLVFMHNLLIKFKWEKLIPTERIIFVHDVAIPQYGLPIKIQNLPHQNNDGGFNS